MADIKAFIKKWDGRTLEDDGSIVSKEFHSFQVAFFNAMRKIAHSLGGELVKPSYGHYDMSGFIKRGDKYVYFDYSNVGNRTKVVLKEHDKYGHFDYGVRCPLLCRTAENERDFRGGHNYFVSVENCEETIERLLNTEHQRV